MKKNNAYDGLGAVMTGGGLGDLVGGGDTTPTMLDLDDIVIKEKQIRDVFEDDENTLEGLAADIKIRGILQSVLVRPNPNGGGYELVAGERRIRAARIAGLTQTPALIRELTDDEAEDAQAMENIQRKGLTMIEEARKLQRDVEALGGRQAVLAKYGKPDGWLSKRLSLLSLPGPAKELITRGLVADLESINNVAQAAKIDPQVAQDFVEELAKRKPGTGNVRAESKKLKESVKPTKEKTKSAPGSKAASEPLPSEIEVDGPAPARDDGLDDLLLSVANSILFEEPKKAISALKGEDKERVEDALHSLYEAGVATRNIGRIVIEGLRTGHFAGDGAGALRLAAFIQGTDSESKFNLLDIFGAVK